MSPDLMTFATCVLQRTLEKAGYLAPPAIDPGQPTQPGDVLIDSLADKVLAFVNRADAAATAGLQSASTTSALQQLRSRANQVARALGACDCFGEDAACPSCRGRGAPGWRLPERAQFEAIVRPALQKISEVRDARRNLQSVNR